MPSLTAEGGVELSDVAPLTIGGTATMPGLTAEGGVSLSDVAPLTLGGTATMPGLVAEGGVELSTVAPLEIGGAATMPGLTAAGGVAFVSGLVQSLAIADQTTRAGQAFTCLPTRTTGGHLPLVFSATESAAGLNVHAATRASCVRCAFRCGNDHGHAHGHGRPGQHGEPGVSILTVRGGCKR